MTVEFFGITAGVVDTSLFETPSHCVSMPATHLLSITFQTVNSATKENVHTGATSTNRLSPN